MINNIVVAGNVVKDPVSRTTPSGKTVSNIRLAVNNPINDKEVLYIDAECWDKQSEFVSKWVKKGSAVSVIGRLKMESYEKNGEKRVSYSIVSREVNFIGSKKKDGTPDNGLPPIEDEIDMSPSPNMSANASNSAAAKAAALLAKKAPAAAVADDEFGA